MDYIIRPPLERDAEGVNALRRMPGVFENTLGFPAEPLIRNRERLASYDPNSHQLMAVLPREDGTEAIIGMAGLSVHPNQRLRHSAGLGIMVHRDYQGQGVGSRLMEALLDIADNWLMLVRVDLEVFTDNARAIHLYEKYGFQIEGTRRKAAIRGGQYVDDYIMARIREDA